MHMQLTLEVTALAALLHMIRSNNYDKCVLPDGRICKIARIQILQHSASANLAKVDPAKALTADDWMRFIILGCSNDNLFILQFLLKIVGSFKFQSRYTINANSPFGWICTYS